MKVSFSRPYGNRGTTSETCVFLDGERVGTIEKRPPEGYLVRVKGIGEFFAPTLTAAKNDVRADLAEGRL